MKPQPTKYDQNAHTNIDQDVANTRQSKYQESQAEVKRYLHDMVGVRFPQVLEKYGTDIQAIDLMDLLRDGEILCKLGSLLPSSKYPANPSTRFKSSKMPFVQMENISFFLSTCELIGLPHNEIFQTVDLYEAKDPLQVVITLMSFSRLAHNIDATVFAPVIGAKPTKVKPNVPSKPFKFRSQ